MSPADRPNILFVCTDQQNWRMNSLNGHPLVKTPNLERLAGMGVNFRRCYSNSPVCAPARASLFTGLYPHEVGAYDNAAPLDGGVPTFGHAARDQGYHCTATGKLDFYANTDYGFEEIRTKHGHDRSPDITAFFRNPIAVRPEDMVNVKDVVREGPPGDWNSMQTTRDFIQDRSCGLGKPWLAWTGWNAPHNAYRTCAEMLELYPVDKIELPEFPEGWRTAEHPVLYMSRYQRDCMQPIPDQRVALDRAAYFGMITEIDQMLGELLEALEATGQLDNTVIIFTSDHGDMMGEHGFFYKNAPYDGCARVPLVIAGPGFPSGTTVDQPVSLVDLHATICDIAGAPLPETTRGCSLRALANGQSGAPAFAYVELNTERLITGVFSVVQGDWKYNHYVGYSHQIFNLAEDPGEWENRIDDPDCGEVVERLRGILYDICDPESVSDAAFADQDRRFNAHIGPGTPEDIYANAQVFSQYSARLGDDQARELIARQCARRAMDPDGARGA